MSLSLITSLMTETIEITRRGSAQFVDGEPVFGPEEVSTAVASVQPMTANEILQLPEHLRTRETLKVYTLAPLRPADEKNQLPADRVEHDGKTFEVHGVWNWTIGTDLPHYKAICVKMDGEGGGDAA